MQQWGGDDDEGDMQPTTHSVHKCASERDKHGQVE